VLTAIEDQTGLRAYDNRGFFWTVVSYYLGNTGIPVNFGITIALGFLVGAAIAGQTFYLFTLENLKQFGALKAMGLANPRLVGMVLLSIRTSADSTSGGRSPPARPSPWS
jgi:putative ABC transport system permease protein